MKRLSLIALVLATPLALMADTTVFQDTFANSSTINGTPGGPSGGNSTSYQVASGNAGSGGSIAGGVMTVNGASSTSLITEVQALFASAPISLLTLGDFVDLSITFTSSGNILNSSGAVTSESLILGLFNSNGSATLQGTLFTSTGGAPATGGAQNWQGFVGRVLSSGTANIITRPMQTGTTSQNQDLLFNNASSGSTFHFPVGTQIGSKSTAAANVTLTALATYTVDLRVTLGASGMIVSNALYNGIDTSTTPIFTDIGTGALTVVGATNTFDGLAFGFRATGGSSIPSALNVSQVLVTINSVPEPNAAVLFLSGIGMLGLYARRLRR